MDVLGSVDGVFHIYSGLERNRGNRGVLFLEKVRFLGIRNPVDI